MEQQIVDRAARLELALIADGRANIVRSLGERIGRLAADDWPKDYEVSLVRIHGEQISSTDSRFCAGDRIRKDMAICDVARNLREWAKKGRLITSVNVF